MIKPSRFLGEAALILLLVFISLSAFANPAWFTRVWKTDDGLPDNNVEAIAQGSDDYLWVVTSTGLARFDGISFNRFPIENFGARVDSHIRTVLCGRSGVLWMASDDGRVIGLNRDFSSINFPQAGLPTHTPQALAEDGDGALWLGYFGSPWTGYSSAVYRVKNNVVTQINGREGLPSGNFHSLISDDSGNIWLAKGRGIYIFRNGQFQRVTNSYVMQCLAATHTNAVWFVSTTHLFRCNADGVLQDCGAFKNPSDLDALALLEDHTGAVWIGTDGDGLFRYSKSGFEKIETSHSTILSLAEDREGNIWAVTAGGGLDRVSLSGVQLETLENNQAMTQIQCICQDSRGVLWGATQNGALVSRINDSWKPVLTNAPFAGTVRCVAAGPGGTLWIGLRDGQLVSLANTNYTILSQTNNHIHSSIFALLPASSGDLWLLRRDSLQYLRDGQIKDVALPRSVQRISAIAADAAGRIWIGAKGAVQRFDGKRFVDETPYLPVSGRAISCLYGTSDGSLWISCDGVGLLRFKDRQVSQIGVAQGLLDDDISQIVADGSGWLWFGSNHGIFKIRQSELEQAMVDRSLHLHPIVYGKNEGLISAEALSSTASPYVLPRAITSQDGCVWLLTHTGVVKADPQLLPENSNPPPLLLTRVAMDGQTIASYGDADTTLPAANLKALNVPLRLPPSHRHLEFDFTAFHYSAPENVRFRYQLAGFDTNWIDAVERNATYSRLTDGKYQFRVEACVGDGPWSERPGTLAFNVAPFLWQTWWFRLGALLLFTTMVIAVVHYISFRRLQVQMHLLEQRAALDKERTRIARDLHDDLGGSLNSVALTLDMMQRLEPPAPVNGKIQHCSTMVRQVARSVDEIVWAINPRNDTLRYMVDYISQFAVEYLHTAEIPCRVDLPDKMPDIMVSPEARHNLLLIVKEALSNIARHASACEVRLSVAVSNNEMAIRIVDNGCGFESAPDNSSCDGLRNMRLRTEEIGGQFQLDSHPGQGTRISIVYSWPSTIGQ